LLFICLFLDVPGLILWNKFPLQYMASDVSAQFFTFFFFNLPS